MLSSAEAHAARAARQRSAADGRFDIAIIGGGIHGAFVALTAAAAGYSVLLLEQFDYAFGTSSRSSKLLHGGIRYLEQKNFKLVFEALRERDLLLTLAPHLTRPLRFLFPVVRPMTPPAWQLSLGLSLYDLLSRFAPDAVEHLPKHQRNRNSTLLAQLGLKAEHSFAYSDAQVEDSRLVVETVVSAAEKGAICLNHTRVESVRETSDPHRFILRWHSRCADPKSEIAGESRARVVFNCAGPWVEDFLHGHQEPDSSSDLIYSRGAHILFDVPWTDEALILPTGERGRYYFVLPYFAPGSACTLVGTTDRVTLVRDTDPQATTEEISELLGFLRRDLPNSQLVEANLYASFCGVRVLKSHGKDFDRVSSVSRSHEWQDRSGVFSLYGGKYTTARSVAAEGVERAVNRYLPRSVGSHNQVKRVSEPLVGGCGYEPVRLMELLCSRYPAASMAERERAIARFGSRVARFEGGVAEHDLLLSQFRYAIQAEHAATVEDVFRRRMIVSLLPARIRGEYSAHALEIRR